MKKYRKKKTWELSRHGQRWTQREEDLLKELYPPAYGEDLSEHFGRTQIAISRRASKLKLQKNWRKYVRPRKGKRWSKREIKRLKKLYPVMPIAQLLERFPKQSKARIIAKAHLLGLKKKYLNPFKRVSDYKPKLWSKKEDEYLIRHYHKTSRNQITAALERTSNAIERRAAYLKIPKKWITPNIETLRQLWQQGKSCEEIAEIIGKTVVSVESKAYSLGLKREPSWTAKETDILKTYYARLSNKQIAEKLDKTVAAVLHKAVRFGLKKDTLWTARDISWTAGEIDILKAYYQTMPNKQIAAKLGSKTITAIKSKACALGLKKRTSWTAGDTDFLQKNYKTLTYRQIAQKLDKTRSAILAKAFRLRLGADTLWTAEEIDILKKYYKGISNEELAPKLGRFGHRSLGAIHQKAGKLGLKKDRYWTAEEIDVLKTYYKTLPNKQLAVKLSNKTVGGIKSKAFSLGLKRDWPWTTEEIDILRIYYKTLPTGQIAQKLGHRSPMAVKQKAHQLGLGKK